MYEPTCKDCKHFRQHYVHFLETHYNPIPCCHCVYPRLKHRKPDTLACVHYRPIENADAGKRRTAGSSCPGGFCHVLL